MLHSMCNPLPRIAVTMGDEAKDRLMHNYVDLQVLLAGGAMKRGHFHFAGKKPLADLWLTLAQRAEVKCDRFADSTGARTELA